MPKGSRCSQRHERHNQTPPPPAKPGRYAVKPHLNPLKIDARLSGKFKSRAEARRYFVKEIGAGRYSWEEVQS